MLIKAFVIYLLAVAVRQTECGKCSYNHLVKKPKVFKTEQMATMVIQ